MISIKRIDRANVAYWLKENTHIDTFYPATENDYGESVKLTAATGIEHIAISLNEDGSGPLIFIPREDVQEEQT